MWTASVLTNLSLWVQNVGAAWLMATLTPSILMVALVQTAATLPAFLFGLPSGVLGDLIDRKRLLLITHGGMLLSAVILAVLAWMQLLDPWMLLVLTFILGSFSAVTITLRQATVSDVVARPALVPAMAYNNIAFNSARAVGPALAGFMLTSTGPAAVFLLTAGLLAGSVLCQWRQRLPPSAQEPFPERLTGAMRSGLRYISNAPLLRSYLMRNALFGAAASGLWALLPVVARSHPDFGASGYGLMLSSLGAGAVCGGLIINRLRARFALDHLVSAAVWGFAATAAAVAMVEQLAILCVALMCGGAAWVIFGTTLSAAYQTSLPKWVRARAISIFLLVIQGGMAFGGAFWGLVAAWSGTPGALILSAIAMLAGLLFSHRHAIRMGDEADFKPSQHWADAVVLTEPQPDDGPVAIQRDYQIDPSRREEFIKAIHELGETRRRNGARSWVLYRDLGNPQKYVERFVVESWGEHQRQQARVTVADRVAEDRVEACHIGAQAVVVSHFVGESNPPRNHTHHTLITPS